jgi:hypothetical protein
MIKLNSKSIATAMAIVSFGATTTGCGSGATVPAVNNANLTNVAPVGYPGGQIGGGGCVPLAQSMGFSALGITALAGRSAPTIAGGNVPTGDTLVSPGVYGQVSAYPGGMAPKTMGISGQTSVIQTSPSGVHPDGSVYMTLSTQQVFSQSQATVSGSGTITITPSKMSVIYGLLGLNYNYTGVPYSYPGYSMQPGFGLGTTPMYGAGMTSTPTVCGIGMSLSINTLNNIDYIDGGKLYLYINGSSQGVYLQF